MVLTLHDLLFVLNSLNDLRQDGDEDKALSNAIDCIPNDQDEQQVRNVQDLTRSK
jgi:hypothetical protein